MAKTRKLTASELELWRQTTRDVKPRVPVENKVTGDKVGGTEEKRKSPLDAEILSDSSTWLSRKQPRAKRWDIQPGSMDRRMLQRLRKGQTVIEGRLDLHGLRQDQAHRQLTDFVERNARAGCRMLLVITGRGSKDDGVLKRATPRWLSSAPLSKHILAISSANTIHGGVGALYVQLRRPHRR